MFRRVLEILIRRVGVQTLLTLSLLLAVLATVARALVDQVPSLDFQLLLICIALAVCVGWLLGKTRLSGALVLTLSTLVGLSAILMQVGQLGWKVLLLLRLVLDALWRIQQTVWPWKPFPDLTPVATVIVELSRNVVTLTVRGSDWLNAMLNSKAIFDPVAAAIVWGIILWLVSFWAAWTIRRHRHVLQALVPATLLLAATYAYTGGDATALLVPLSALLLLMVVVGHAAREERWRAASIDYSEDLRFDMTLVVVPVACGIVAMAGIVPSISIQQIVDLAENAMRQHAQDIKPLPDSLGLRPQPQPAPVVDVLANPGLPREHLLGSGPELSKQVAMIISTGDLPASATTIGEPVNVPHYYWRSSTYDRYTGPGWYTSDFQGQLYKATDIASASVLTDYRKVRQTVQLNKDLVGTLYVAGTLVTADHDFTINRRSVFDVFDVKTDAMTYRADSLVPVATVAQLRASQTDYPEWIRDRYLDLPNDVPERVLALARSLTATQPTPYDRARAIETYLRTYSYTLDLPQPPIARDVVDYFLFDLKRGYCDYFASAMVVLARAAGLPARLVIGYASGTYDLHSAQYIVTQADAHSWPEIYFTNYGWIEFEPTSSRPLLQQPADDSNAGSSNLAALEPLSPVLGPYVLSLQDAAVVVVILAITLSILWLIVDLLRLRRLAPDAVVPEVFMRLYRRSGMLKISVTKGATPYEFATSMLHRVTEVTPARYRQSVVNDVADEVNTLTGLYVRQRYSRYQPDDIDRWFTLATWQRLSIHLWLAWLTQLATAQFQVIKRFARRE